MKKSLMENFIFCAVLPRRNSSVSHERKVSSISLFKSNPPEVFLGSVLKIWSKFTEEHPCPSVIQ